MTSVYQMMRDNDVDEIDVADNTFDEICAWGLPDDEVDPADRNFNASVRFILKNTVALSIQGNPGGYRWIIADIAGFVEKHYYALRDFTRECCRDTMDYRDRDNNILVGIRTVNGLVCGYFGEADYRRFLWMMGSRAVKGSTRPTTNPRKNPRSEQTASAVRRAASKPAKTTRAGGKAPASKSGKAKNPAKKAKGRC